VVVKDKNYLFYWRVNHNKIKATRQIKASLLIIRISAIMTDKIKLSRVLLVSAEAEKKQFF
jgi:hypothetical protein